MPDGTDDVVDGESVVHIGGGADAFLLDVREPVVQPLLYAALSGGVVGEVFDERGSDEFSLGAGFACVDSGFDFFADFGGDA